MLLGLPLTAVHSQTVPDVTGVYTGTGSLTMTGCQDPDDNGTYGPFNTQITLGPQNGSSFTGSYTATAVIQGFQIREEATITSGTVDSRGVLSGAFESTLFINGFFDSSGVGTFTGSLTGNTLRVDTSFRDTVGDTCTGTGTFTATRPAPSNPDLVVTPVSVSASSLTTGQSFTISATVRNQGSGSSNSTTLRYFRSLDSTISTSDTALGTDAVPSLAAGAISNQSHNTQAPASSGTFYVGACVDVVSGESSTSNNCSIGILITVTAPVQNPDLIVSPIGISESNLTTEQIFTINTTVQNQGSGSSNSTTLRYLLSVDSTISPADTAIATDAVPGLAAGTMSILSRDTQAPASPGTFYVGACVDAVSGESSTSNNCSSGIEITVSEPAANLPHFLSPILSTLLLEEGTSNTTANIVFATSTTQNGNLGGLAGADQLCAARAAAAGLTGNYVAWLSTSSVDAIDRLGDASGWVRPDGKPFANTPLGAIYYPIRQDEFGNELGDRQVFTGTGHNGTKVTGNMCADWTANTGDGGAGGTNLTHISWTDHYGGADACSFERSIYCFGVDYSADVTPTSSSTRIAFLSDGNFSPGSGIAEADALCQTEATGAGLTGTFKALLATASESPESRFNLTGSPWVRPDGAEIAATPLALFDQGVPDTTINMTLGGSYFSGYERIWTGIGPAQQGLGMKTPGTAATTCNSWNSNLSSEEGQSGYAGDTVVQFGVVLGGSFGAIPRNCDLSLRIYCLEN